MLKYSGSMTHLLPTANDCDGLQNFGLQEF
jgi:hypothetical protein